MKKEKTMLSPVDVNNDAEMVSAGIRNPFVKPRDPSVWTKTEKERKVWKKHRHFPAPNIRWAAPERISKYSAKLIVQVQGLENTTYSHKCTDIDVSYILGKYKTEHCSIIGAFWNGREISPEGLYRQSI